MGKKLIIIVGVVLVLAIAMFFVIGRSDSNSVTGNAIGIASAQEVTMFKSPNCGCCVGHAGYLDGKGFDVDVIANDVGLQKVKGDYNIPFNMRSCHTSFIDGYFVEGHVPMEAINKLIEEKPDIDGIALPNMPAGSPGMPGVKSGDWIIYSVKDGQSSEFMRI